MWSKEFPKTIGYYWHREGSDTGPVWISVVQIKMDKDKKCLAMFIFATTGSKTLPLTWSEKDLNEYMQKNPGFQAEFKPVKSYKDDDDSGESVAFVINE